jgi:anti-sigma regulatory factor (Ser/Thr protein kinase)
MNASFAVDLRDGLDAARAARRAVEANHGRLPSPVQSDLSLIVTELVTNAVRHGGAGNDRLLEFESCSRDGHIRVEVLEPGTGFHSPFLPQNIATDADADVHAGGWGLFLVDRIAKRWGVASGAGGLRIWFELPVAAPP